MNVAIEIWESGIRKTLSFSNFIEVIMMEHTE